MTACTGGWGSSSCIATTNSWCWRRERLRPMTDAPNPDGSSPRTTKFSASTADGDRSVEAVHGADGDLARVDHDRARCRGRAEDREQLRLPRAVPLLRRHRLPPHHQGVRLPGWRSGGHRPRRSRATASKTSCRRPGATRSGRSRWQTPAPTRTAASSSSSAAATGRGLPPQYSLFGKVVKGLDVVEAMQSVPTGSGDRPKDDVVINSVTITESD